MTDKHRTPYAEDELRVQNGTQPQEIREFVEERAKNPIVIGDTVVWNFNNHEVNYEVLERQVEDFLYDEFVIPFQASGVWGFMVTLLPEEIREAEILAYDQSKGQYNPYPSFARHSEEEVNNELRQRIAVEIRGKYV